MHSLDSAVPRPKGLATREEQEKEQEEEEQQEEEHELGDPEHSPVSVWQSLKRDDPPRQRPPQMRAAWSRRGFVRGQRCQESEKASAFIGWRWPTVSPFGGGHADVCSGFPEASAAAQSAAIVRGGAAARGSEHAEVALAATPTSLLGSPLCGRRGPARGLARGGDASRGARLRPPVA